MRVLHALVACALIAFAARAHSTPPVRLVTEREAATRLIGAAARYFVREVRPSPTERATIRQRTGWNADAGRYRMYVGRTAEGAALASAVFLTDFTLHGPVRVGVALAPDGKVKGVAVVEVSEEAYSWVKPLLDRGFLDRFAGTDASSAPAVAEAAGTSMQQFYARVIAGLVARAAVLYEVAVRGRQTGQSTRSAPGAPSP